MQEPADHPHDDWFRPFDQDEEERKYSNEVKQCTDITCDPEVAVEGESSEAQRAQVVKDPGTPTPKEIAEHEITHLPHRSWCAACVAGRSRDRPHKRLHNREHGSVPTIVFDYGFMGGKNEAETASILAVRDVDTKMLFAHDVPRKGLVSDHGMQQLLKDIGRLGYQKSV